MAQRLGLLEVEAEEVAVLVGHVTFILTSVATFSGPLAVTLRLGSLRDHLLSTRSALWPQGTTEVQNGYAS
jgi:hypothetical protein